MPISYYQMKKHLYQDRYYENKRKEQENYEFFKEYGGEKEYYRQQYIKAGYYTGGPPVTAPEPAIILETEELTGATIREEDAPVVAVVGLAGTAGLEGLTATDFCDGTDLVDGATPVVG